MTLLETTSANALLLTRHTRNRLSMP